jgi:hypothetical protein
MAQPPSQDLQTYRDPAGRFEFTYPSSFGQTSPGSDDGFRDRVAAIRFSEFSSGFRARRMTLGGEAVLTRGAPQLDLQAAGGLYNAIALQIFPENIAAVVRNALPVLTASNLCEALGRKQHLDPADSRLSSLTAQQRDGVPRVDEMGNSEPELKGCDLAGESVTFDKESITVSGGVRRHIYGAVRFLQAPYSSFQLIRGSDDAPSAELLRQITAVVNSWRATE